MIGFFKVKNSDFKNDLESEKSEVGLPVGYIRSSPQHEFIFHGPKSSILDFISKLEAFIRKLQIWINNWESKQHGMFKILIFLLRQLDEKMFEIRCHLKQLRRELMHYFPAMECAYISNPSLLPVGTGEQEDIIDTQSDETARAKGKRCSPLNF